MRIDDYGLLVTDAGDGGDTARNEWSLMLGLGHPRLLPALSLFKNDYKELIRNPKPDIFWSDAKQTSRDQTLHAFTYLASVHKPGFWKFVRAHLERGLLCQNGDLLWANINVITRAAGNWYLYPLSVLWDISLIFGALERIHLLPRWDQDSLQLRFSNDPDDVGDDLNLQMSLVQPGHASPIRWLARMMYKLWRPKTLGSELPGCLNVAHGCWLWYYRKEESNLLNLSQIWSNNCKKYF